MSARLSMTHASPEQNRRLADPRLPNRDVDLVCRQALGRTALAAAVVALVGLGIGGWLLAEPPSKGADSALWVLPVWGLTLAIIGLLFARTLRRFQRHLSLMAESRERNRAIVDNMVDGAIHIDSDGHLVALNAGAEQMFRRVSAEVRGHGISMLLAEQHRDELEDLIRGAAGLRQGNSQGAPDGLLHEVRELTGVRSDDNEFPLYLALSQVDVGKQPVFTAIARDLSETRRRMEELAYARDQAMAADRAKSQFLAVMSHEIRTPMNGILGMLDLLRDGTLTKQQREFIETAEQSSQTLLGIINDILDLSKIEAGKLEIQHIDFDLRSTVEEVAALAAGYARERELEIVSYVEPSVPTSVVGDPFRLRQVLTNLTNNAVKFTQKGEVVVHVSAETVTETNAVVRVRVKDTGIGIDDETRSLLFRPFSQADASTTRRFGGTGLGLAISKRLVKLMGGDIGVDSEPGIGSTFWFTVPLERAEEPAESSTTQLRDVDILVVDDNATNRLILENYLRNWGARSESVESGVQALRAMQRAADQKRPFRLAILDMQMPEMDGIELAQRIKGDASLADTHLLLLSSLGFPGDEARRAGIEVSLLKPVRQKMLQDAVLKLLGKHSSEAVALVKPEPRAQFRARVLVAEDNLVNQRVIGLMLGKVGIETTFASDGRAAVEALAPDHGYDLVFMDIHMPIMNGQEATREIRNAEARYGGASAPIIAMTASATANDRRACLDSGMDDFVSKPVQREALEAVLRRWLPQSALLDAPAATSADDSTRT